MAASYVSMAPACNSGKSHQLICWLSPLQDGDENKLCYMQLFEAYCDLLEGSIQRALQAAVPGVSMNEFAALLGERQEQLGAEVGAATSGKACPASCWT
jgi:hypothetical protein